MEWDIKKIEQKYRDYMTKDNSSLTMEDILSKNNFADMLNFHYGKKVYSNDYTGCEYRPEFYVKYHAKFSEVINRLCYQICDFQYARVTPKLFYKGKKISLVECDESIEDYFKYYDTSALELYRRYKEEQRIEYREKSYKGESALGRCYNTFDDGNYVSVVYKNTLKECGIIVHEMSHANIIENISDYDQGTNYICSSFCETLPIYNELLYSDYLYEQGNKTEAVNNMAKILDNFTLYLEYYYDMLIALKGKDYLVNSTLKKTIALLLTFKLYHMFHQDPSKAEIAVAKLGTMLGSCSDFEIFQEFELENVREDIEFTFSHYYSMARDKKHGVNKTV